MTTPPYFGSEIEQTVSNIGAKVAKARAERGWSLQQLAKRAGLSPASIHKIEKSGMTPTITSLMKVAAALGKSVGWFIEESDGLRPVTVVRRDERTRLHTSKEGLVLNNISGRYGPFFVAGAEADVEPWADSGPQPMVHPGEELVLLVEGTMTFTIDAVPYELEEGDSIHFRTAYPHSCGNPPDRRARAIWLPIRSSSRRGRNPMRIVIACGGNALIREDERGTWTEQTAHALEAARAIARVARAHEVVLTHGNGPQVGALALQQAGGEPDAPALPFDVLDAMTQGEIGYLLQQAIAAVDPSLPTATILTRVRVNPDDPALVDEAPTKPIGPFYDEATARRLAVDFGWHVAP